MDVIGTGPAQRAAFPLPPDALEAWRLQVLRRAPAGQVGAHLRRRQGQSLEFHDYRAYSPGDDFRHIDWRASARLGRPGSLIVRTYAAEQRLTLAVSIDTRDSMWLPETMPKVIQARWLAQAVAMVALASGDRVILHRMFGTADAGIEELRRRDPLRVEASLDRLAGTPASAEPNLDALQPRLPPAAVWLIVTDLYYDDPAGLWRDAMLRAQQGSRWVILVELDSWPGERAILAGGPKRVDGPGIDGPPLELEIDPDAMAEVDGRIAAHTLANQDGAGRGGLSRTVWNWPDAPAPDPASFFTTRFMTDPLLQRLFRRHPW